MHAGQGQLIGFGPGLPVLRKQLDSGSIPRRLAVDEQAVHVEDDGVDHGQLLSWSYDAKQPARTSSEAWAVAPGQ